MNGDLFLYAHGYVSPTREPGIPEDQMKLPGSDTSIDQIVTGLGSRAQVAMLVRGGVQGQLNIIVENDDPASYGAALDKLYADEGYQQFYARAQAAEAMTPIRSADYVEIPGCELPLVS